MKNVYAKECHGEFYGEKNKKKDQYDAVKTRINLYKYGFLFPQKIGEDGERCPS